VFFTYEYKFNKFQEAKEININNKKVDNRKVVQMTIKEIGQLSDCVKWLKQIKKTQGLLIFGMSLNPPKKCTENSSMHI